MPGETDALAGDNQVLAGITSMKIVGSAASATALAAVLAAGGHGDIAITAVDEPVAGGVSAADERVRILALTDLCPETTMSASLRTGIEQGTTAGDFAIGLAQAARTRGASVDQLRAGAVQPGELPAGKATTSTPGKAKTGAEKATGILALAKSAGHRALGHLPKAG